MKSLKKTMTKAASKAMAGVGMTSGVAAAPADARAGWEDFSDFSNAVPIGGGASLGARAVPLHDGLGAEMEPHPLTKDWAARIKNPKVRAAFAKQPLESYADAHALNVWTGTWNTNGKPPPASLDISAWLDVASSPDLVVVGFQEIVPLTPGKVLMQEDAQATGEWEAIIERCLNGAESETSKTSPPAPAPTPAPPAADGWTAFGSNATFPDARPGSEKASAPSSRYVRVACKQLVGVYITVWASRGVSRFISDVRVAAVATGVNLGVTMLGNKGGAAVWLKVHNTPLCFVCAHLSAGSKENDAQKRSEDYREIFSKLSFPPPPAASSDGSFEKPAGVADAFAAVWIGDLNYRLNLADDFVRSSLAGITSEISGRDVVEDFRVRSAYAAERTRRFASLLGADQLSLERAAGKAFVGWTEAPVAFAPTYKYRPGTHTYSGAGDADEEHETAAGGDSARPAVSAEGGEEETHAGVVRSRVVARTRRDADVVRRDARVDAQRPQARVQLVYRNRAAPVPAETADRASGDPARAGRRGDGVAASVRGAQPARRVRGTPLVRRAEDDDVPAGQHRGRAGVVELCRRGSG
jgi:phosphatidylinositol-bisphosphatase